MCAPFIPPIVTVGLGVYMIIGNWATFQHPPQIHTWSQCESIILSNPANETIFLFGSFLLGLGILTYIIRIPFSDWSQLKLFGVFEATRIREDAKDEFRSFRALEFNRLVLLSTVTSELGVQAITDRFIDTGLEVDIQSVLDDLISGIKDSYFDSGLQLPVRGSFIHADAPIPTDVPLMATRAIEGLRKKHLQTTSKRNGWGESSVAVRIILGPETYDLWFYSTEFIFTETDEVYLTTLKHTIEYNFERAVLSRYEQEIVATIAKKD